MADLQAIEQSAAASAAISGVASKATIGGGIGATIYTLLGNDTFISVIAVACTVCTFLVNWIFKRREYNLNIRKLEMEMDLRRQAEARRERESLARIDAMRNGGTYYPPLPDTLTGA